MYSLIVHKKAQMLQGCNKWEGELQGLQKTHDLFLTFAAYTQRALQMQCGKA